MRSRRMLITGSVGLAGLTLASACICSLPTYFFVLPPRAKGMVNNLVLPGTETTDLHALDPAFRRNVESILSELEDRGFHPRIAASYRSPERQRTYYLLGRIERSLGLSAVTQVTRSCHNHRAQGNPAALAIDIWGGRPGAASEEHAVFFRALRDAAQARGLVSGAAWSQSNAAWKRYGIGWDPAHVEAPGCMARVKQMTSNDE